MKEYLVTWPRNKQFRLECIPGTCCWYLELNGTIGVWVFGQGVSPYSTSRDEILSRWRWTPGFALPSGDYMEGLERLRGYRPDKLSRVEFAGTGGHCFIYGVSSPLKRSGLPTLWDRIRSGGTVFGVGVGEALDDEA